MPEFLSLEIGGFSMMTLLNAVIVAAICLILIKIILSVVDRMFQRIHMDPTVEKLIRFALKILLLFLGVVIVMDCLEIPVTSLVAAFSVVGLAVSLAVQNFLANVAGGLQIIASKPFALGDFVEIGSCSGTVVESGLFYTKLSTSDKKLIQLPNSTVVAANIINYSAEENRRVEIKVSVSYDNAIEDVRAVLTRLVGEHPLTLATPEPAIHVSAYGQSTIEYVARVWCANGDYWTVYNDVMDQLKPAFDQAGISMSYPHVNVHMVEK